MSNATFSSLTQLPAASINTTGEPDALDITLPTFGFTLLPLDESPLSSAFASLALASSFGIVCCVGSSVFVEID